MAPMPSSGGADVSTTERAVLDALRAAGEPLSISAIANRTQRSPSVVGRAVRMLALSGHVTRQQTGVQMLWRLEAPADGVTAMRSSA